MSNLSTNDELKYYCDNVDYYKHENHELKKVVFQLKLEMKSQLEQCLIEQKHNLKCVVKKYKGFIEDLLVQKSQLSVKCDDWKQKLEYQYQIIEEQRQQIYNQQQIIQQNLLTIQEIELIVEQQRIQKQIEVQQIMNLKDQTIDELHQIIQQQQQ
ncbi:unnamed protein product [Paramecium sonneborni]|uniref:Uncharacterized protein n=1 Tax=Paramecium sonneborni TaxID=65129 RepID=A0A8S1PXC6_9CILI|nr:unnamed protein product [Paramecium sonneborni]